jgi:nucleoside-diphosphate-sugar epimerase
VNAAVTGGTGFVGQALVRLCAADGHAVRVLVRQPHLDATIRSMGAEPVRGDLAIPGACDDFVRPGDVVCHLAARVDLTGRWADYYNTTVEGTRRLLAAALPRRPARFVYVSSGGVYSPKHKRGSMSAERTPAAPASYNHYGRAKLEAENLVRAECERTGCEWSILRLGFLLYGPCNGPLLRHLALLGERQRAYVIGNGQNRISTLYVDDAARAVILAGTHPAAAGKIYDVASAECVTQQELLGAMADVLGLPRPGRHVNRRAARFAATMAELAAWALGRQAAFTRGMVDLMSATLVLDASRIRRELGWQPEVTFAEGMERMREWYAQLPEHERGAGVRSAPDAMPQSAG